jgi:catechol 2,3-dioxygenase-like lactoylglutathione lyase family enzyme
MPELDGIGLVVADMAASLGFYRRLGLEIPAEAEKEDHVEAHLKGGLRLMFDTQELIRGIDPEWTPAGGGPPVGFAFRLESPAQVDALYAELTGLGHMGHKAPWDAFWGQRYATLRDPDGNGVDLYAPL